MESIPSRYEYLWLLLRHDFGEDASIHLTAYLEGNKDWIEKQRPYYNTWLDIPSRFSSELDSLHLDYIKTWSVSLYIARVSCFVEPTTPQQELLDLVAFLATSDNSQLTATIIRADGRKKNKRILNPSTIRLLQSVIKAGMPTEDSIPILSPIGKNHTERSESSRAIIAAPMYFRLFDILTEQGIIPTKLSTRRRLHFVSTLLYRSGIVNSTKYKGNGEYLKLLLSRYGITHY